MTEFHTREFVEAMHTEQLRLHGGAPGIRDVGMLESALARPLQKAIYGDPDIFGLAAAYLFGIVNNRPFVDGNERTALAATDLFLVFNGWSLETDDASLTQFVLMVAAGKIDEAGAAAFLRDHTEQA
jgi:death-on-curing protein